MLSSHYAERHQGPAVGLHGLGGVHERGAAAHGTDMHAGGGSYGAHYGGGPAGGIGGPYSYPPYSSQQAYGDTAFSSTQNTGSVPVPDVFQRSKAYDAGSASQQPYETYRTEEDASMRFGRQSNLPFVGAAPAKTPAAQRRADEPAPRVLWLRLINAPGELQTLRTITLPATVGRVSEMGMQPSARNAIFASTYLSRHHALIKVENGRVVIEDLGSCNGTFVNSQEVFAGEQVVLADGDIVKFGFSDDEQSDSVIIAQVAFSPPVVADSAAGSEYAPMRVPAAYHAPTGRDYPHTTSVADALRDRITVGRDADALSWSEHHNGGVLSTDPASRRIGAINRMLTSMGSSLRSGTSSGAEQLPVLEAVAEILQQHMDDQRRDEAATENLGGVLARAAPTVRQRPSSAAAVRVIAVYEFAFCVLAFLFARYVLC